MPKGTCETCLFWDSNRPLPEWYYDEYRVSRYGGYEGICKLFSQLLFNDEEKCKAPIPAAICGDQEGGFGQFYTSRDFRCQHYNMRS